MEATEHLELEIQGYNKSLLYSFLNTVVDVTATDGRANRCVRGVCVVCV